MCTVAFLFFQSTNCFANISQRAHNQIKGKYQSFYSTKALIIGSLVEWLKRRARVQHGLDSKPTRAILLCPWERHFTALSPAW